MKRFPELCWPDWEIVEEIGSGSYGKVYKIKREESGHTYFDALKVINVPKERAEIDELRNSGMDFENITEYFQERADKIFREIDAMIQLGGVTNIVSYKDHKMIRKEDGVGCDIFIRMELLTPLIQYQHLHKMNIQMVIQMGIDICRALELCEKRNIIHRDIKPANIFISDNDDFKLGDFGIARTVTESTVGTVAGTYTYMAPEIYFNGSYNSNIDIYSLGLVLYQYLNHGRLPFMPPYTEKVRPGDMERAVTRRMQGEPIPAMEGVTSELNEVVCKACEFDAKKRYRSVKEFRMKLEDCLLAVDDTEYGQAASIEECEETVIEACEETVIEECEETVMEEYENTVMEECEATEILENPEKTVLLKTLEKAEETDNQLEKMEEEKEEWMSSVEEVTVREEKKEQKGWGKESQALLLVGIVIVALMVLVIQLSSGNGSYDGNKENEIQDVIIEEQVLFYHNGIMITATGFEADGMFGPEIEVIVENNSQQNITVDVRNSSVNGYMIGLGFIDVAAGETVIDAIQISKTDLDMCGIKTIADIEFNFLIYDSESVNTIVESDMIKISTSASGSYVQEYDDSGEVLYEKNGIKIISKGLLEEGVYGADAMLYIENNSDKNVTVWTRHTSVNGVRIDPYIDGGIMSGKKTVTGMSFFSDDLDENGISAIETIETSFEIVEQNSWDTIDDGEMITISYK